MDPNIMKLLEDDEDDNMHSGADVEAFTAALNRDIEGDTSTSQPSNSDTGVLPPGSNPTSNQLFTPWQNSGQEENVTVQNKHEEVQKLQLQEQQSSKVEPIQHGSGSENQEQQIGVIQEHSQLPLQHKDDQLKGQEEQNPPQFSQKSGHQISEQNLGHFAEQDRMRHPENQQQHPKLQKINEQQAPAAESENRSKQVSFGMLLPVIVPHLDKDRAMQVNMLFARLKRNEIGKDGFVRLMRNIVGDQMLRQAVLKIQMQQTKSQAARISQTGPHQPQAQSQSSSQHQQQVKMPSLNASQFSDSHQFSQVHQKSHRAPTDPTQVPTATVGVQSDSSFPTVEGNGQKSRESDLHSDSQGVHVSHASSSSLNVVNQERDLSTIPARGLNKQQQQHLHLPQTSYPMYGANIGNYHGHAYSGQSVGTSSTSLKPQTQDPQMRQVPLQQSMVSTQSGGTAKPMSSVSVPNYEIQNSINDPKRLHGGSLSHMTSHSPLQHNPVPWQSSVSKDKKGSSLASMPYVKQELLDQTQEQQRSQFSASSSSTSFNAGQADQSNLAPAGTNSISVSMPTQLDPGRTQVPSPTTSVGPGTNIKTPPKKPPSSGQKKPFDALGTPSSMANKKQKVSGAFLDQSIDQLNDVTAVSGVNLREEEEQLFSGPKEESRASEATRRVVQEEEERLILQKIPLQKKMAKIMSKCGIKNVSKDVERCLSLSLEERMRGLISNLIRVSKQRVDIERPRHRTLITSDVRRQILTMNRKAKEDWEKKQAEEAEKLRKINEVEGNTGTDGEKDKDEGRAKPLKANKEEDDKMRTTAANVAARVAVGGDDMLSKWQLMVEAKQKREGVDTASVVSLGKDVSRRPSSNSGRTTRENQEAENRSPSTAAASGAIRKVGRNPVVMPHTKVVRTISVKDVIAVLEREPQMSKSTLVYRLYERMRADAPAAE